LGVARPSSRYPCLVGRASAHSVGLAPAAELRRRPNALRMQAPAGENLRELSLIRNKFNPGLEGMSRLGSREQGECTAQAVVSRREQDA
jgi:hypothetical protein